MPGATGCCVWASIGRGFTLRPWWVTVTGIFPIHAPAPRAAPIGARDGRLSPRPRSSCESGETKRSPGPDTASIVPVLMSYAPQRIGCRCEPAGPLFPADGDHGTLQRDTVIMRYFQATEITRPEADHIRLTADDLVSKIVVISLGTRWHDVRHLTEKELHGLSTN